MVKTVEQETKKTLRNYGICVGIEVLIGFCVIWSKGFFQESTAVNLQIWADAFFVAGILIFCLGQLMVQSMAMGAGPRDTLVLGLGRKVPKVPIGAVTDLPS